MNPLLLLGSTALSGLGSWLDQNAAVKQAQATKKARDTVLNTTLGKEDQFSAQNRDLFGGTMSNFTPEAQGAALSGAQGSRVASNTGAITAADPGAIPLSGDAPGAVRGEIAKRMAMYGDRSTRNATNQGDLSGYGDVTLGNDLGVRDTGNHIATNNNFAQGQSSITPALQDYAEVQAYKAPSVLGSFLKLAGTLGGAAAGKGIGSGASASGGVGNLGNAGGTGGGLGGFY